MDGVELWRLRPELSSPQRSRSAVRGGKPARTVRGGKPARKVRRHLPLGSGPHSVGCVDVMTGHTDRGSLFRLFYPTHKSDVYKRDKEWPLWLPRKQYGLGYAYFLNRNPKVVGKIFNWLGGDVYVPALWQAPLLRGHKFPVVILSHGIGGNRTTYSTLCCELASHGFVVAALEHRDGSASMTMCLKENRESTIQSLQDLLTSQEELGGPQLRDNVQEEWRSFEHVEQWDDFNYRNGQMYHRATECSRALDVLTAMNRGKAFQNALGIVFNTAQFRDCLDLSRVSMVGHSFGGATCLCACTKDERFRVAVVLDGWMHPLDEAVYEGVRQPVLMLNYETFHWKKNIQQMQRLLSAPAERLMLTVKGTCHQSVTDFQFVTSKWFGRLMDVRYTLSPAVCMDVSASATLGFLHKHLGLEDREQHEDILSARHRLVISGTNVALD